MSAKIEAYKKARDEADQIKKMVENLSKSDCDKKGVRVELKESWYGWYGRSSTSSWGTSVEKAFVEQIQKDYLALLQNAFRRYEAIADKAKKDAYEEAKSIVEELENENS